MLYKMLKEEDIEGWQPVKSDSPIIAPHFNMTLDLIDLQIK